MQDLCLKLWCSASVRIAEMKEDQRGASAVEYSLMVALIATVIVGVVKGLGGKTHNAFQTVNRRLP